MLKNVSMRRVRVIPVLLIDDHGLYKPKQFKNPAYIGDPVNAAKIFNDKEVDELIVLDMGRAKSRKEPDIEYIKEFAAECFMPLAYGGGISSVEQMSEILTAGAEKVVVNTMAYTNPKIISEAANEFGSQSIVVSIDVNKNWLGKYKIVVEGGRKSIGMDPITYAKRMEDHGAGEIMVQSVYKEGTFSGYDLDLIHDVSSEVSIPVIACGGASSVQDMKKAVKEGGASAVAAGSMFVFKSEARGILINFPDQKTLKNELFSVI